MVNCFNSLKVASDPLLQQLIILSLFDLCIIIILFSKCQSIYFHSLTDKLRYKKMYNYKICK